MATRGSRSHTALPGDISRGDRAVIIELSSVHFERLHLYNSLRWSQDRMNLVGRVGLVIRVDAEHETANVRFYASECVERPYPKYWDATMECTLPLLALRRIDDLFFAVNDKVLLVSLTNPRPEVTLDATYAIKSVDYRTHHYSIQSVSIKMNRPIRRPWNREENHDETVLPVYLGANLALLQQEIERAPMEYNRRGGGRGRGDRPWQERRLPGASSGEDPRRILYPPKATVPSSEGAELIDAITKWTSNHTLKYDFEKAVRDKPELVDKPINGVLPIQAAVAQGNWDAVVALIVVGADRNAVDAEKNTLFHIAAKHGQPRVIEGLFYFIPGDINAVNLDGETALHVAARCSSNSAVAFDRLLQAKDIKLNITNHVGDTVMHTVVKLEESETKQAMMSRLLLNVRTHANLSVFNAAGNSPLHLAAIWGMAKTVESILHARPPLISAPSKSGLGAFHLAALHGRSKVVHAILELFPDASSSMLVPGTDSSALHLVVSQWNANVERDLDRLATLQALLSSHSLVNHRDRSGDTALHIIMEQIALNSDAYTRINVADIIAKLGKEVKMSEIASKVRPHWELAAVLMLAMNGADPRIPNEKGRRPGDAVPPELASALFGGAVVRAACGRPRSLLPMKAHGAADSTDIVKDNAICTFNCDDSPANVQYSPCGHRVICTSCIKDTPVRRCQLCYKTIESATNVTDGTAIEISRRPEERRAAEAAEKKRCEEEATAVANEKKEAEVAELRARLEELEARDQCVICMDARATKVFECGHTACPECSSALKLCHICRRPVATAITLFN